MSSVIDLVRSLGLPPHRPGGNLPYNPAKLDDARRSQFVIYHRTVELRPPIDWNRDPFGSRSWLYALHTLQMLDILYQLHLQGDDDALDRALRIALDWIAANPHGGPSTNEFAWYDMAVGRRGPQLAYLLRAAACDGVLDEREATTLLEAVRAHGAYLAADENYKPRHNHGLHQDEGLLLLAHYLPFLEEAPGWRAIAERRFLETLHSTVAWNDGVHLEHSPNYHLGILKMVRRVRGLVGLECPPLIEIEERMSAAAPWFVLPDDTLTPFGDTERLPLPEDLRPPAGGPTGLRLFPEAGFAVVRAGGSYFAACAGYHAKAHKHGDELSFVLYEGGRLLVGDAGRYGYYEDDPARQYARSCHAHNVVLVDGGFEWRGQPRYGSGILAGGAGAGWFVVVGVNPLVRRLGVEHRRLFLYRPGTALVLVDDLRADAPHAYTRLLHFHPGVDLVPATEGFVVRADGASGAVSDGAEPPARLETVHGRLEPGLLGWTFTGDRGRVPSWTARLESVESDALLPTAFVLGAERPVRVRARRSSVGYEVDLDLPTAPVALVVHTREGSLRVEAR